MAQTVRGMRDIFGAEIAAWHRAEEVFRTISAAFGYEEFRTPILEHSDLFQRGIGQETDIVGKEMYTFVDRSGDSLSLRPEMTAPIARAAIEHTLVRHTPVTRLWYNAALFRHERPQKGRYRQFHQYGAECLGSPWPEADAEVILLAYDVIKAIGLTQFRLEINTLGSAESRAVYRAALVDYLNAHRSEMSGDAQRRIDTNPLRVLDSKDEHDKAVIANAPRLRDHLDETSTAHFNAVLALLDAAGVPYTINPVMVRGLDYYCHTVFEFVTDALGTQNAIGGGGRYDPLFAMLGGGDTPAVGFSLGIERLLLLSEVEAGGWGEAARPDLYIVTMGDTARVPAGLIAMRLRRAGRTVVTDVLRRSVKSQMKDANRVRARWVAVIGDDELQKGTVSLKHMDSGDQIEVPHTEIETTLASRE